ncbi:ELMO domain-containing protein 2 [Scaptodrosophila lebanonensis]|uniref:ELMO domain-containing protein 2 n=1 Tax=Drosophila lebanonensis TaxID=7225 RepID=A0A6J2TDY4_DROLE|nr:ELMO domain-containing protein 2 [Scaptodrosophila lebanonensis]
MFLLDKILPFIFGYIRPFIKWFLHVFTRLSELQRICYGAKAGASRTRQVERSLQLSKHPDIKCLLLELDQAAPYADDAELLYFAQRATHVIGKVKKIKPNVHPDFGRIFGNCITAIYGYKRLMHTAEQLRAEKYDAENPEHEQKLLQLWRLLMPEEPLTARITKQWQDIGFQGDDPKTDFRGMGMLGLENLLYFARVYNDAAKHVLLHSKHPTLGYTFAIVGINLTSMAFKFLKTGAVKTHFYNQAATYKQHYSTLEDFHKLYCYLFFEFDRFWMESDPRDIMDFREIYQAFEISKLEALHKDSTLFVTNLVVESV